MALMLITSRSEHIWRSLFLLSFLYLVNQGMQPRHTHTSYLCTWVRQDQAMGAVIKLCSPVRRFGCFSPTDHDLCSQKCQPARAHVCILGGCGEACPWPVRRTGTIQRSLLEILGLVPMLPGAHVLLLRSLLIISYELSSLPSPLSLIERLRDDCLSRKKAACSRISVLSILSNAAAVQNHHICP
jgi:hypothetical protein